MSLSMRNAQSARAQFDGGSPFSYHLWQFRNYARRKREPCSGLTTSSTNSHEYSETLCWTLQNHACAGPSSGMPQYRPPNFSSHNFKNSMETVKPKLSQRCDRLSTLVLAPGMRMRFVWGKGDIQHHMRKSCSGKDLHLPFRG
eukprot:5819227-Amphidinium_carterae.2